MKIQITRQEAIEAWKKINLNLVRVSNNATIEIVDNPLGLISQPNTSAGQAGILKKPIGGNYLDLSQGVASTGTNRDYLPQTTLSNPIEISNRLN